MQHEKFSAECSAQTRLETVSSIQKRQANDLYQIAYCLSETLAKLIGETPKEAHVKENPPASGLLFDIERNLEINEQALSFLSGLEKEFSSLI